MRIHLNIKTVNKSKQKKTDNCETAKQIETLLMNHGEKLILFSRHLRLYATKYIQVETGGYNIVNSNV